MKSLIFLFVAIKLLAVNAAAAQADEVVDYLKSASQRLESSGDLDPLLERIGDARVVLLGEASHGTSEYYKWRAEISKRLITEKGFDFIVVEGDWPASYEVNRYIKQLPEAAASTRDALDGFQRWPRWMWANSDVYELVKWLADYNRDRAPDARAGFYGFDVYSLPESIEMVLEYSRNEAPTLTESIARDYGCLIPFASDPQNYARHTLSGENCAREAEKVVSLLRDNSEKLTKKNPKAFFAASQNAAVVKQAEQHYRAMTSSQSSSWNKRVEHMKATLSRLLEHHGPESRAVVWAHNTHIGDARATDMANAGMKNIGWLARERYGEEQVVAVGFSTHRGEVLAGRQWGAEVETMTVPSAQSGSIEAMFNRTGLKSAMVIWNDEEIPATLKEHIGHRAIGVVYNPLTEHRNYVPTVLPQRYDAFIFIDETTPLSALE